MFLFRTKIKDNNGQMTVELAIVFPILIIIGVLAVNILSFVSTCSSFDRFVKNETRRIASTPLISETSEDCKNNILTSIGSKFNANNLEVECTQENQGEYVKYICKLKWYPTLFGLGLKRDVFGISLPCLTHEESLCVDEFRAGDLL